MVSGISSNSQYQTSAVGSKQEPKEPPAEIKQKLISAGVPESTISQGKEAVKTYVDSHPEVKQKLEAEKAGAQQQPQAQGSIMQSGGASAAVAPEGAGGNLDLSA